MPSRNQSPTGLSQFALDANNTGTEPQKLTATRGKNARVGIAVRLSHEDWHRATDFAMREQTSLQRLLVAGISESMRRRGLPPLAGN